MRIPISAINYDERNLVPVIVQDANTRQVLTLAYMNTESLKRTLETGETWFWSRSRNTLWHKGETSGNTQRVLDIAVDCDHDALTILVEPNGPACHTGAQSCFHNQLQDAPSVEGNNRTELDDLGKVLSELYRLLETRRRDKPEGSYSSYLFAQGLDKILKKVGEESAETIIAAKNAEDSALVREISDLLYHLMVLLVERGVTLESIRQELKNRRAKDNK